MKFLKTTFLFLLPAASFAQADTVWYNSKGLVCIKDSAFMYATVVKDNQGWLQQKFFAENNQLFSYGFFTEANCAFRNGLSVWHWKGGRRDSLFYEKHS